MRDRDTWTSRDLPVLQAIADLIEETGSHADGSAIVSRTGLTTAQVSRAVKSLEDEYLRDVHWDADWFPDLYPIVQGITSEARRTVGQWPSAEAAAERFIAAIEQQIIESETDEQRSRLVRIRDAVTVAGRDLLVDVMGAVLTKTITG